MVLWLRINSVRTAYALARLLPQRKRVVLATSHAPEISGNLEFIRDELDRRDPPIPYTVLAYRQPKARTNRWKVAVQGMKAGYYLATSRVFIVDDYFFPLYVIEPRKGSTVVQTWHASGAFKKIGWSVLDKTFGADDELVDRVAIHSNYDVCLMASKSAAVHYADAFHQPLERFRTDIGMPRTDVLFGEENIARISAGLREKYRLPEGKRVVLYAPTFRGTAVHRATSPKNLDIALLERELGADHVLLMRLHPFVRESAPIPAGLEDFAIDVSDHPDIHELMHVSDVLVTDYSSAIFEFSLLNRPMAFFAPDHAEYDDERGFYFDFRTGVPGPIFETTGELAAWLRAGEFDLARVARFRDESFEIADGHATERFVDQIVLPALG
jgi:teichoic acid ribitol-phosphate primase